MNNAPMYFIAICTWSKTTKKDLIRWSPVCHPGKMWNAINSDLSSSKYWLLPVGGDIASIQCAVTAINGHKFGSLHTSVVNDTFPMAL